MPRFNDPIYPYGSANYSAGLPNDEFRTLRKRQDRERLNIHFEHKGNRYGTVEFPYSADREDGYRRKGLPQGERVRVSEIRNATRAVLGASFDFGDDSYERSRRRNDDYARSRGWKDDAPRGRTELIPHKYLDEFIKGWHEDVEDNDPDQYLADNTLWLDATWRRHEEIRYPVGQTFPIDCTPRPRPHTAAPKRADSGYGSERRRPITPPPQSLPSKFSFDSPKEPSR